MCSQENKREQVIVSFVKLRSVVKNSSSQQWEEKDSSRGSAIVM
jgi:hypothetical protein